MTTSAPSYCKKCGYSLAGLAADGTACPECGRAFDPADPSTFDNVPRRTRRRRLARRLVLIELLIGAVAAFFPRGYAIGRLTLAAPGQPIQSVERIQLAPPRWFSQATKLSYPAWNRGVSTTAAAADLPAGSGFRFSATNYRFSLKGATNMGSSMATGNADNLATGSINGVPISLASARAIFDTFLPDMVADIPHSIQFMLLEPGAFQSGQATTDIDDPR